jgi:hypothetical protein
MTASPPDLESLTATVALLEKRLGRLRILTLVAFALGAGAVAALLLRQPPAIQEGSLWMARDDQGRVRGTFGVSQTGVGLTMYDTTGRLRLDLGLSPGAIPGLVLITPEGETAAVLNLTERGMPALRMMDPKTKHRMVFTSDTEVGRSDQK